MTTFHIDLLHPEAFAKSWRDWFVGLQAARKPLISFGVEALSVLEIVGINVPRLYALYREHMAHRGHRIYAGGRAQIEGALTTFNIDILYTGEFAKTWHDWFVGRQGGRRLLFSYILAALVVLAIVGIGIPKRYALSGEHQAIKELRQKIAQGKKDLKDQQNQFLGIIELERYEVTWSEVLRALSVAMPHDLWLRSIEFVDDAPPPKPRAVAAKVSKAPTQQLFRLVLVAPLTPGSGHLVDVNRFLNDLTEDSRFKKRFRLQDWEVTPFKMGTGEKEEQRLITTVTYKVVS